MTAGHSPSQQYVASARKAENRVPKHASHRKRLVFSHKSNANLGTRIGDSRIANNTMAMSLTFQRAAGLLRKTMAFLTSFGLSAFEVCLLVPELFVVTSVPQYGVANTTNPSIAKPLRNCRVCGVVVRTGLCQPRLATGIRSEHSRILPSRHRRGFRSQSEDLPNTIRSCIN